MIPHDEPFFKPVGSPRLQPRADRPGIGWNTGGVRAGKARRQHMKKGPRLLGPHRGTEADAVSIAFASPKSNTLTVPSSRTLMLAGLRSRWITPASWAASSASAICFTIGSASSSGIGPSAIRSARVGPSTNSSTSARVPSASSIPWIWAMLGWLRLARICASRLNRASRSGSAAKASGRSFRATSRLSCVSVACQTCPIPPSPSR